MATIQSSRRLAHFSTVRNVDRLIYCVRDGYRSVPAAMAATLKPIEWDFMKDGSCCVLDFAWTWLEGTDG